MSQRPPPLPELEISAATKKKGFEQNEIDDILRTLHERYPDFFARVAQREADFPGNVDRDPNAGPNDAVVQEFQKYIREAMAGKATVRDINESGVWTQVFWEMRRRSRLMYGMRA